MFAEELIRVQGFEESRGRVRKNRHKGTEAEDSRQ